MEYVFYVDLKNKYGGNHKIEFFINWDIAKRGPQKKISNFKIEAIYSGSIISREYGIDGDWVSQREVGDSDILKEIINANRSLFDMTFVKNMSHVFGESNIFNDDNFNTFFLNLDNEIKLLIDKYRSGNLNKNDIKHTEIIYSRLNDGIYDFNVENGDIFHEKVSKQSFKITMLSDNEDDVRSDEELDEEYVERNFESDEESEIAIHQIQEIEVDPSDVINNDGIIKPEYWPLSVDGAKLPGNIGKESSNQNSVTINDTIKNKYIPIINKLGNSMTIGKKEYKLTLGLKLLAIVMTQKEGFTSKSKSYRTNNPGNIGNTDNGNSKQFTSLEEGIKYQLKYLYEVASGTHKNYKIGKSINIEPYYSKEVADNQKNYGGMNPYLVGYKFNYSGKIEEFVKIYSTGSRATNSYISMIISWYRINGFPWVNDETKLSKLMEQTSDKGYIFKNIVA